MFCYWMCLLYFSTFFHFILFYNITDERNSNFQCILIAFAALLALAAGSSYVPSLYSASTPLAYSNYVASPYAAGYVTPYIASPYTAIQYSAAPVAVAPAIPSG